MHKTPARWLWHGLIPLGTGLLWLAFGFGYGPAGLGISLIPGSFLLATGLAMVFWGGDSRIPQFMALAAILGVILSIPGMALYEIGLGFLLLFASAASYLAAGFGVMRQSSPPAVVPQARRGPANAAKVALDEAMLGYFANSASIPSGTDAMTLVEETRQWLRMIGDRSWADNPADFHCVPPALENPNLEEQSFRHLNYELMSFGSEYEPYPEQPGATRWRNYAANRIAYARVFRHPGAARPWVIGIHGYRMGWPFMDFPLFGPRWLHESLSLNLLLPVLPLHGPRKEGWRTGDGFLEGNLADTVNAEAQTIWDIRRMLSWIRNSEQAPSVGVLGYSLGGYNAALLGCLEPALDCLIAGIPAVDLPHLLWQHTPPAQVRYLEEQGVGLEQAQAAMQVVSPLAMACRVPLERRFMFAGIVDRLVPPGQVLRLHAHWQQPRLEWYQGGHLTFRGQTGVARLIREGLQAGGLIE
jgi:hypothetical protein